jgi:hypothetical protein
MVDHRGRRSYSRIRGFWAPPASQGGSGGAERGAPFAGPRRRCARPPLRPPRTPAPAARRHVVQRDRRRCLRHRNGLSPGAQGPAHDPVGARGGGELRQRARAGAAPPLLRRLRCPVPRAIRRPSQSAGRGGMRALGCGMCGSVANRHQPRQLQRRVSLACALALRPTHCAGSPFPPPCSWWSASTAPGRTGPTCQASKRPTASSPPRTWRRRAGRARRGAPAHARAGRVLGECWASASRARPQFPGRPRINAPSPGPPKQIRVPGRADAVH